MNEIAEWQSLRPAVSTMRRRFMNYLAEWAATDCTFVRSYEKYKCSARLYCAQQIAYILVVSEKEFRHEVVRPHRSRSLCRHGSDELRVGRDRYLQLRCRGPVRDEM